MISMEEKQVFPVGSRFGVGFCQLALKCGVSCNEIAIGLVQAGAEPGLKINRIGRGYS